ncbi:hypothetical protein SAMN04489730_6285 [Amycolatopsis australiensis]|uniref:Uncharacterized protein n=1 Tax=Amycolatopsis australiensis TaxID=546364 RepID=A0A1K1SPL7_9PSEU|nr:hypothetical protein SAMN04489730_6285 [Amycolatopsis australiensis]
MLLRLRGQPKQRGVPERPSLRKSPGGLKMPRGVPERPVPSRRWELRGVPERPMPPEQRKPPEPPE